MANFSRFLWNNLWSGSSGSIAALSAASALPAAASQNPDRTYVYRSLSQTANQYLTRDLGSAQAVTALGVANVRLQNAGALKLYEGGSSASPGVYNLVATLPSQDADTRVATAAFGSVSARHWKLEWENGIPATPDYVELGFACLAAFFEPSRHPVLPLGLRRADPSVMRASVDGQQTWTQRTHFASGALVFNNAPEADLDTYRQMYRQLGRRTPFFFILDDSLGYQQWLLRFASDVDFTRKPVPGRYDVALAVEEAR